MNLFTFFEKNRNLVVWGMTTICLVTLAVTARRPDYSNDVFWHLKTGLDWLQNGLSPWIDHYSFTFSGNEISAQPYIFQVAVAWLSDTFGLSAGIQIFKFFSFVLTFGLIVLFLHREKAPSILYLLILPMAVFLIQLRPITRPEIVSFSFCAIAVMLYHEAQGEMSRSKMIPIALLIFVWVNYHNAILGYVIFFGLFVDSAIMQIKSKTNFRRWIPWFYWGLILIGLSFLTPNKNNGIFGSILFDPEWKTLIQEYQPASIYFGLPPIYGLLIITLATAVIALHKRKYGYLTVLIILFINSSIMSRLVTPSGIIVLCLLISMVSEFNLVKSLEKRGPFNSLATVAMLAVSLITLAYSVIYARNMLLSNSMSLERFPWSTTEYMLQNGMRGRILNAHDIGGFLIYRLSNTSSVYIDGRTNVLYPKDFLKRYLGVIRSPEHMRDELTHYDVTYSILRNDNWTHTIMQDAGVMELDFVDTEYALFTKANAKFPAIGRLLAYPACFDPDLTDKLEQEIRLGVETLPDDSPLIPYFSVISGFSKAFDQKIFLTQLENLPIHDLHIIRFGAYQSLKLGYFELAMRFLYRTSDNDLSDYVALAIAQTGLGKWEAARNTLFRASQVNWPYVNPNQHTLLYGTLKLIEPHADLSPISESFIELQKKFVLDSGDSLDDLKLDVSLFCNSANSHSI